MYVCRKVAYIEITQEQQMGVTLNNMPRHVLHVRSEYSIVPLVSNPRWPQPITQRLFLSLFLFC